MKIIAITGPAGSGKSTVASKLAKQIDQSVNIDADHVKHMIVNDFVYDETSEGIKQWELLGKNIGLLAQSFQQAGYNIIINGYLNEPAWNNIFKHVVLTHKFLLLPGLETIKSRDKQRPKKWILGEKEVGVHYKYFSASAFYKNFTKLDTTNHSVEETAQAIYKNLL